MSAQDDGVDPARIPVVILAGGRGARFDHESHVLPKPMIRVAGKPIIEHVIDGFVHQGFREFIVATGYLGWRFSEHLSAISESSVHADSYDLCRMQIERSLCHHSDGLVAHAFVTLTDTGDDAHTGLRLSRVASLIDGRDFVLTYGDGLCDVDMQALIEMHRREQAHLAPTVTVTAVNPPGRFGVVELEPDCGFPHFGLLRSFDEKPRTDQWINGGFMFVENSFLDEYLANGEELEAGALRECARRHNVCAYLHRGYWRCMDTRRDLEQIEADVAAAGRLPWLLTKPSGDRMDP